MSIKIFNYHYIIFCFFLLIACPDSNNYNDNSKTQIEFINQENFPVSVYTDSLLTNEIAKIDGNSSVKIPATPNSVGTAFHYVHSVILEDIILIRYESPVIVRRIDENVITQIFLPGLSSISSPSVYIKIINKSTENLSFNTNTGELLPIDAKSTLIIHNEEKAYKLNPGASSSYSIKKNTNIPVPFPESLGDFAENNIYIFEYDGLNLILKVVEINLSTARIGLLKSSNTNLSVKLNLVKTIAENESKYTILIFNDEEIDPAVLSYNDKDITINIKSNNSGKRTIRLKSAGSLFRIGKNVKLVLEDNINLIGINNNTDSLVTIDDSGVFTINNSGLSGNITSGKGGGVLINSGGQFNMNGGKISNNISDTHGGGVFIEKNGSFRMYNGEISGNLSRKGSGGGVHNAGIFQMSGGVVYGNNASNSLKNVAAEFHAVSVISSLSMYGTYNSVFTLMGIINSSDNTIRVVNGTLETN